jgi:SAM-dependent methyltransferase
MTESMASPASAATLAKRYGLLEHQTEHRLKILKNFNLPHNSKILEIGCGQGDMTAVLASTLSDAHIDAIDPAPLDYGSPETLGQAQTRVISHDIGTRIAFHQSHPVSWLEGREGDSYDVAIMCHCLWYFASKDEVRRVLEAAKGKAKHLCIAEWALQAMGKQGQTHILTALVRGTCESHIPNSTQNIRTPLHPAQIKRVAEEAGWTLIREDIWAPDPRLEDAKWEAGMLLQDDGRKFLERARSNVAEKRVLVLLESMVNAVKNAKTKEDQESQGLSCMDVWTGVFE